MESYYGGLSLGVLLYCLVVIFLASLVRGYSGFGLAALLITSLALVLSPQEIVPIALLLELLASLTLLRGVWKDVAWPAMGWLLLGAGLGTPLGVLALANWPEQLMRIIMAVMVLGASLLLWFGARYPGHPGAGSTLGAGLVSGVANGAAAIGGLPLVIFLMALTATPAVIRATLIAYLLLLNCYGAAALAVGGLIPFEALLRTGLFALPMLAGVSLGRRQFLDTSPESFRRFTLVLLMVLSLLSLIRALA